MIKSNVILNIKKNSKFAENAQQKENYSNSRIIVFI